MEPTTVSYGAMELKATTQRYWVEGFVLSVAIHSLVLAAFALWWSDVSTDISKIPLHRPWVGDIVIKNPVIPGIAERPRNPGRTENAAAKKGMPVPVPESLVGQEATVATQEELAEGVDPHGLELGGGNAGDLSIDKATGEDEPVPFEAVEKLPVLVSRPAPVYPEVAIKAGIEGRVVVKVLVGKDGHVHDAVVQYSTAEILNEAALAAAREYIFVPAVMNSGPVSVWMSVPFSFRLK